MTKNLHLFAIGNAIVDILLHVSHEEFSALNIPKGTMILVNADEQKVLLDRFLHLPAKKVSGGSAANTVIAFAQFGGKAGYGSILGNDEHGLLYSSEFNSLGIELMADLTDEHFTGTCLVLVTPDAERTMNTSLAVNTRYAKEHLSEDAIKRTEWLYIEGYKFTEPSGAEAIDQAVFYAKKYDTNIAVTASDTFIVNVFGENLRKVVAKADLLFCNEPEAQAYSGADNSAEAFRALQSLVPNVAMTLGGNGSKLHIGGRDFDIPSHPTTAVDTTGAGDMYAAGLLYGLTHKLSPEMSGVLASHAASRVISRVGPRLEQEHISEIRERILG